MAPGSAACSYRSGCSWTWALGGLALSRRRNPRRPVATFERFNKVRQSIQQLSDQAQEARERDRWIRLELALVLAEGTGRRIGSIRQLRWSDVAYDPPSILWRAEFDKRRREQRVPIPESLATYIRSTRARLAAVGDHWVFKQAYKDAPWAPAQCQDFLRQAEAAAGVEKLDGGLWHAYRRKWATERKELPLKDVAAARGVEGCDHVADVLSARRRGHDVEGDGVAGPAGEPSRGQRSGETVAETVAADENRRRLHTTKVVQSLRVAPPGLEPGLS
jgi:integrase